MSSDSSAMHAAVLATVARPLEDSLNYAQRQQPLRTDINPLLEALKPYTHRQRREVTSFSELENWATTSGGGLLAALRHTMEPLIPWTSAFSTSADVTPPQYTHRQLLETLKILGAKAVLQFFLDELMAHFDNGDLSDLEIVFDIIVTMITAPQNQFSFPITVATVAAAAAATIGGNGPYNNPSGQLTLRDALHTEFLESFRLSKSNLPRATMIVRLYRRVEAYFIRVGNETNGDAVAADVLLHDVVGVVGVGGGLSVGVGVGMGMGMGMGVGVEMGVSVRVGNAEGLPMPATDLDEVLQDVEADTQITQDLLSAGNASFLGVR